MFLNNNMTSQRIQNLLDSSLKLIEQSIAEGKTDVALAYLKVFYPHELVNVPLLNLNMTAPSLKEQEYWGNEERSP